MEPVKWNQGVKPAVPWWLNFDPYPWFEQCPTDYSGAWTQPSGFALCHSAEVPQAQKLPRLYSTWPRNTANKPFSSRMSCNPHPFDWSPLVSVFEEPPGPLPKKKHNNNENSATERGFQKQNKKTRLLAATGPHFWGIDHADSQSSGPPPQSLATQWPPSGHLLPPHHD